EWIHPQRIATTARMEVILQRQSKVIRMNWTMTTWTEKDFLVDALLSIVGGSSEDGEGGRVDSGSGNG
ncbi:unnamed protein product, partial [Pylaiella littoralis]